jgi:hypothetical protein
MKVEELRVGNLIYDLTDSVARVDTVSNLFDGPMIEAHSSQMLASKEPDCYKPIPLTEEWLLKFGFVKERNLSVPDTSNEYFYVKDNLMLTCFVFDNRLTIEFHYRSFDIACYLSKKLEFVHQLQNLYFELKDKELTIQK